MALDHNFVNAIMIGTNFSFPILLNINGDCKKKCHTVTPNVKPAITRSIVTSGAFIDIDIILLMMGNGEWVNGEWVNGGERRRM
jgi:hypothetical protein